MYCFGRIPIVHLEGQQMSLCQITELLDTLVQAEKGTHNLRVLYVPIFSPDNYTSRGRAGGLSEWRYKREWNNFDSIIAQAEASTKIGFRSAWRNIIGAYIN